MFRFHKYYSDMLYNFLDTCNQPSENKHCYRESLPCEEEKLAENKKRDEYKDEEWPCPEKPCVHIWGQVKDCEGKPVKEALVKLVKVDCITGKLKPVRSANTVSDCKGFYQFNVYAEDDKARYFVIASKAAAFD